MIEYYDIIFLFLAGCLAGTISGLLGVGGGIINVAILTYYFERLHVSDIELTRFVLSNSFLAIFFSSLFGSFQQIRMKNFFLKEVLLTTVTTISLSFTFSFLIIHFDWYSKGRFSLFFISILAALIIKMIWSIRNKKNTEFLDNISSRHFIITGIFTGIFSALSGLGGGVVTVPILSDIHRLKIKKATSISLGVMPLMALFNIIAYSLQQSSSITQVAIGYIKPDITLPLVAGVMIFAPLGVRLAAKLSEITIRIIFVVVVSLVIIRMFFSIL